MEWGGGVGNVPLLIRGGGGRRRQSHLHEDVLHPGWPGERGEVSRASDCRSDGRRDGSRPAGLQGVVFIIINISISSICDLVISHGR